MSEAAAKKPKGYLDPIKEAKAVETLRESLRALGGEGDEALLLDSIEGETNLFEAIDLLLAENADDQAIVAAIELQVQNLANRKERFKKRTEARKAVIEQAFITADLPKIERPLGTVYLSARAPKAVIETESEIPAKFWEAGDPVLNKKALLEELKERAADLDAVLASEPGEARDLALANFAQRHLDAEQASKLRDGLVALDAECRAEVCDAILASLRHRFSTIPGATLAAGTRSLSIRTA